MHEIDVRFLRVTGLDHVIVDQFTQACKDKIGVSHHRMHFLHLSDHPCIFSKRRNCFNSVHANISYQHFYLYLFTFTVKQKLSMRIKVEMHHHISALQSMNECFT